MNDKVYTVSRSRKICGDTCQRKRYWNYEHAGTGIVGPGSNLRAARGIAVHAILEAAQRGEDIARATEDAKLQFSTDFLSLETLQGWEYDRAHTLKEQCFFLDVASRTVVPSIAQRLADEYNILLVEGVHTVPLVEDVVNWYSREDALLKSKADGSRWLFSFKTVEDFQPWKHLEGATYALQNVTEPWAAMKDGYEDIKGVAMLWFEVGTSKVNKEKGCYEIDSPLVRPWFDGKETFFWKYRFNGRQIPKGAEKVSVCDLMSPDEWSRMLLDRRVLPTEEDPLVDRYYGPVLYLYPPQEQVDRRIHQLQVSQADRQNAAEVTALALESGDINEWNACLDHYWPQNELSCRFCSYKELCWDGPQALTQIGTKFKPRAKRVHIETLVEQEGGDA